METEIPEEYQSMEPLVEAGEKEIENILRNIEKRASNPTEKTAEATVQLSTSKQLKEIVDRYSKENQKIAWVNLKALGVGLLSLIPILGGAGEASTALVDAAVLEGATKTQAEALSKGAVVNESGAIGKSLTKILGERGAAKVASVLKELDPFPDIPSGVVVGSGLAEAAGLEGAGAIPAGLQLLVNEFKKMKLNFETGKEISQALLGSPEAKKVKDSVGSTIANIKTRMSNAASPKMAEAAAMFST